MQLASLISDLTTLQACDSVAALALVTTGSGQRQDDSRTAASDVAGEKAKADEQKDDLDMRRATNLLRLHQDVKVAFTSSSAASGSGTALDPASTNWELQEARRNVSRALRGLEINPGARPLSTQSALSSQASQKIHQVMAEVQDDDEDAELEAWS